MKRFSVITPVHLWNKQRVDDFVRCANSLRNQTFKDFEWIVIDDGSTQEFLWQSIEDIANIIVHKTHEERVIAYNTAFDLAGGEWWIFLDSDDEFEPNTLERMDEIIRDNPDYKMFNFGCKFIHKDGKITTRDPFEPKKKETGHEIFGGGNIVNGTFIFSKDVWKDLGGFPPAYINDVDTGQINYGGVRNLFMGSPYDFSAQAQLEFPEIRQYFFVNHESEPDKIIKELGNPWGQDYYIWYKYTRKYHSLPVKEYFYRVYPR